MLMEEENVSALLPDEKNSALQQPQQDSWTSVDHQCINGEQQAIVSGETEMQINQAHGTDRLSPFTEAEQETSEVSEQWEHIIWPVRPMTCTSPPISLATVQWDMPDPTPELSSLSLTNEVDPGHVTRIDATSPLLHQSKDIDAEVFAQEIIEEDDGFDFQSLNSDLERTGSDSEPCDAADVQEPAAQEKEDSTHELLDKNNEIPPGTDSEEEEGHSANSDLVETVDLIDNLEEEEGSEDEVIGFVDVQLEEEQEEPNILLTGQGELEEEQTTPNDVETEENGEEGKVEEEQSETNVSCSEESEEAESVGCLSDVEVLEEQLQIDNSGPTVDPEELIDLQQSEASEERRHSGNLEDTEILERLHEGPIGQTEELEMCQDVDQNVDPEQSEATQENEISLIQLADNSERIENSQEILELSDKLEEHQDSDHTALQELSPQPEYAEQLETTEESEQIQAEESLQAGQGHSEDQSEQPQHLEQSSQIEVTEESTQPENTDLPEESTRSEQTVCVKAEDPVESEQIQAEESLQADQGHSEDQLEQPQHLEQSSQIEVTEESTQPENTDLPQESTRSEQTVCVEAEDPVESEQIQAEESLQADQGHSEDQLEQPQHLEQSPQVEVTEESTQPENTDLPEESTQSEQTVCVEAEDPVEAEQQEQMEPSEQNEQTSESSEPTPVQPEEMDVSEVTEQLSAESEVTQQTAETELSQVHKKAEMLHQAEEVGGNEDGSVQTVVANGEQPKPPETAVPLMNGGEVDREKAHCLAEQLFKLDGIQRMDVVKHLDKDCDFSRAVGEEYLKFFDFTGQTLDQALRSFLKVVVLIGETQERERVLQHFSCRFHQCNPNSFSSSGPVLALTCALMLLNTDLHGQNVGKSMSSSKFVSNLDGMNDGENFSKDLLKSLYNSIKSEPLEWAIDEEELKVSVMVDEDGEDEALLRSKANPFQDVPHDKKACVVKEGFLQRKLHADIDGKRTPWGKRGWKTFNGVLKGMVLYLQKNDYRRDQPINEEVVSVHHSLAEQAADYTKKPHVFRLQTADWRVFLFQASSKVEMNSWISRINLVSALHSSPPFPAAVGSQRRFFRPILPCSQSAHTMERQLQSHSGMLESFKADLSYLQKNPPEGKKAKAKELEEHRLRAEYLQHEVCRYEIYIQVLEAWKSLKKTGAGELTTTDLTLFDKAVLPDSVGEEDEEEGLKKSHSSPSLELEMATPTVVKVRRNISERRTYRRTIIPRLNKET